MNRVRFNTRVAIQRSDAKKRKQEFFVGDDNDDDDDDNDDDDDDDKYDKYGDKEPVLKRDGGHVTAFV